MLMKLQELRTHGAEEGFTLLELMIVVVIIGILSAIAIPIFMNQQKGALAASLKSDVKNTVTAITERLTVDPTSADISVGVMPVQTGTNVVTIAGSWDNYTVRGENPDADPACVIYSSTTGKIADCAPSGEAGGTPAPGNEGDDETGGTGGGDIGSGVSVTLLSSYDSMAGSGFMYGDRMYSVPAVKVSIYSDGAIQATSTGEFRYTLQDGSESVFENAFTGTITMGVWRAGPGINTSDTVTMTISDGRLVSTSGAAAQQTLDIIGGSQQGNVYVRGYGDYNFFSA